MPPAVPSPGWAGWRLYKEPAADSRRPQDFMLTRLEMSCSSFPYCYLRQFLPIVIIPVVVLRTHLFTAVDTVKKTLQQIDSVFTGKSRGAVLSSGMWVHSPPLIRFAGILFLAEVRGNRRGRGLLRLGGLFQYDC